MKQIRCDNNYRLYRRLYVYRGYVMWVAFSETVFKVLSVSA